jgi:hypothetical protein
MYLFQMPQINIRNETKIKVKLEEVEEKEEEEEEKIRAIKN